MSAINNRAKSGVIMSTKVLKPRAIITKCYAGIHYGKDVRRELGHIIVDESEEMIEFSLHDDDDEIYFQGWYYPGEDDFWPLDCYGAAYGCTILRVRENGRMVQL